MNTAFAHPVTRGLIIATIAVLLGAAVAIAALSATGRVSPALRRELWLRTLSWAGLLPVMLVPVLLGRPWVIAAVTILGLLCLREYDRATGLFREPLITATVVLGILLVNFAALDHWYGFFMALTPLTVAALAVVTIPQDRPQGYIQRVGLAVLSFLLFGAGLAHLGYMANDAGYRPLLVMLLTTVALNDVFAFCWGKALGGPKLLPATSPNKTISGALGALVCTSVLVALIASRIFAGTALDHWVLLLILGALVSIGGQAGDLMLSSIKRDLGIKDMGTLIPGHGGLLDRFNSLLLVSPATFHFVNYVVGFGADQPVRLVLGMSDWRLRPARDHGLTPGERLRSLGRERGLGGLMLGEAWCWLVRAYLRLFHRLRVTGLGTLPPAPFVIVANHSSHLDALTVGAALPRALGRRAYALAAGDTFFTSLRGAAFAAYAVNALPVWRRKTSARDLVTMRARLAEDRAVLILFPEGTRTRTGAMARFQPGIGALVGGTEIPVVPCWIEGAFAAWPADRRWPRPGRLSLTVGAPLTFPDATADRAGMMAVASACEQAVRALAP